jgi:hypothetical protein
MRVKPQTVYDPLATGLAGLVFLTFLPLLMQTMNQFLSGAGLGRSGGQSYPMGYPVQRLADVMWG